MFNAKDQAVSIEQPAEQPGSVPGTMNIQNVVIHTMPKKFLNHGAQSAHQARGMGILILSVGLVFLIGIFAALYFLVIKPGMDKTVTPALVPEKPAAVTTEKKIEAPAAPAENASDNIETPLEPDLTAATTTETEVLASSTETIDSGNAAIAETPAEAAATGSPAAVEAKKTAVDSDMDGLTDLEETALGTGPDKTDSDGDGYPDYSELFSLYNPAGSGKLIVNTSIEKYSNSTYGYALYYPAAWTVNSAIGEDSIFFQIDTTQFVQVITQTNDANLDIESWYKQQTGASFINTGQTVYKAGWSGVKSEDGLIYYLLKPGSDKIFTLSYNLGTGNIIGYKNIFDVMVASFDVGN
jgi:hypothetical protein